MNDTQKEKILKRFCDSYEGREKEVGCKPLVYGDLLLIAEEMAIPVKEVAMVISVEIDKAFKELKW